MKKSSSVLRASVKLPKAPELTKLQKEIMDRRQWNELNSIVKDHVPLYKQEDEPVKKVSMGLFLESKVSAQKPINKPY